MGKTRQHIICFGEILWDIYPDGKRIGGAPFNVAAHLCRLGHESSIVSAVGNDQLGQEILANAGAMHIETSLLQTNQYPTGQVLVTLDDNGIPSYEILHPVAWDHIQLKQHALEKVQAARAMIFGSLAARSDTSQDTLNAFLEISEFNVFDVNLRQNFYTFSLLDTLLRESDIVKLNDEEYAYLAKQQGQDNADYYRFLNEEFGVGVIIQTKGAHGAEVYADGLLHAHPGFKVSVMDTVGSGDAFLAGFLSQFFKGEDLNVALEYACGLGAFVASQKGAIPNYGADEISRIIRKSGS